MLGVIKIICFEHNVYETIKTKKQFIAANDVALSKKSQIKK